LLLLKPFSDTRIFSSFRISNDCGLDLLYWTEKQNFIHLANQEGILFTADNFVFYISREQGSCACFWVRGSLTVNGNTKRSNPVEEIEKKMHFLAATRARKFSARPKVTDPAASRRTDNRRNGQITSK
jgi:hypothetical protein